jgi:hypothetical protein
MGLKNLPSCLKMGIILGGIYCVLFFVGMLLSLIIPSVIWLILTISLPGVWFTSFVFKISFFTDGIAWLFFIFSLITYFLIGIVIGWIYRKIRYKN